MGLLTKDELRETLDRAWRRSWERRINEQWEKKLRQLAATDPTVADAINTITDAVVTVWEGQHR